jgi:hypothetical protein
MDLNRDDRRKFTTLRKRIVNNAVFIFTGNGKFSGAYEPAEGFRQIFSRPDWQRLIKTQEIVVSAFGTCMQTGTAADPPPSLKRKVVQKLQETIKQDLALRELFESSPYVQLMCNVLSVSFREQPGDELSHTLDKPARQSSQTPSSFVDVHHEGSTLARQLNDVLESPDKANSIHEAIQDERRAKRSASQAPNTIAAVNENDMQLESPTAIMLLPQKTDASQPPRTLEASTTSHSQQEIFWTRQVQEYKSEEEHLEREHKLNTHRMKQEMEMYNVQNLQFEIAKGKIATKLKEVELQRLLRDIESRNVSLRSHPCME